MINTGTTIVTFLMVFLIQNTQNRDTLAIQLKLSELVLAMKGAQNKFAAIEDLTDEELEELHENSRARVETTVQHIEGRRKNREIAPQIRTGAASRYEGTSAGLFMICESFCGTFILWCKFAKGRYHLFGRTSHRTVSLCAGMGAGG